MTLLEARPAALVDAGGAVALCPGSGQPAPARAATTATCPECGIVVDLDADPAGWGGAVLEDHPGEP